ncbi:MAG: sigma-70 family RNA polymerase sigma factor [Planctomycetes bacterium]|nr:sigma-70 family RNA polymerase sigma factor [Planctomycetota bacterium]
MDETTFESWVRDHGGAVYRAAQRILRDAAEAEDVAQQVFLAALEGRVRPEAGADPGAQLRWWAAKTALFHLRSRRRRDAREEVHAMQRTEHQAPTDALESEETRRAVARAVDELPEELRLPVVLRFEQGLAFRAIGELCAIAEATAFERVQRGLERLKRELSRVGLAGVAPALPEMLARVPEGVALPATLQAELGALWSHATIASTGAAISASGGGALAAASGTWVGTRLLIAASFALLCGALAWWGGWLSAPEPTPRTSVAAIDAETRALAAEERIARTNSRQPNEASPAPQAPEQGQEQRRAPSAAAALLRGRFTDPEGRPIAGAEVEAHSLESRDKMARFAARGTSAVDGSFALELEVARAEGQRYEWSVRAEGFAPRRAPESLSLAPREERDLGELRLELPEGELAGEAELLVRVVDPLGAPVANAEVELYAPRRTDPDAWMGGEVQHQRTNARGEARYREKSLGLRHVRVRASEQGLASREVAHSLRAGANELAVELARGHSLTGRLRTPAGEPLERCSLALRRGARVLASTHPAPDGSFAFGALDDGEHEFFFSGGTSWSSFRVRDVRAGDSPLEFALKPLQSTEDRGLHDAELHGILVDEESGAELPALEHDLELHAVGPGARDELIARDALRWLTPFFGQTAQWEMEPREPSARFVLGGLAAGRYVLVAQRAGYAPYLSEVLELGERELRAGYRIALRRGATLRGRVTGAEGNALAKAIVFVAPTSAGAAAAIAARDREVREKNGQSYLLFGPYVETDAEGRFALEHVSPEIAAELWVLHPRHAPRSWPLRGIADGVAQDELELALRELR